MNKNRDEAKKGAAQTLARESYEARRRVLVLRHFLVALERETRTTSAFLRLGGKEEEGFCGDEGIFFGCWDGRDGGRLEGD